MMGSVPAGALAWVRFALIIAMVLILVLFVARARASWRETGRRPAWIASFFALAGLITLGGVIPLELVDGALGGSNFWNLAQAVCATVSFWFFYRATRLEMSEGGRVSQNLWVLAILVGGEIILFAFIEDRGATSETFVPDHISDPACYAYLMLYIVSIGSLTGRAAWLTRKRRTGVSGIFFLGYALVALACVSHVFYLTMAHFGIGGSSQHEALRGTFYLLFGPGVLVLAVAFTTVFVRRQRKELQPLWRLRVVRTAAIGHKVLGSPRTAAGVVAALFAPEPRYRAYADATRLYDATFQDDALLTSSERRLLARINSDVLRHLGVEHEVLSIADVLR